MCRSRRSSRNAGGLDDRGGRDRGGDPRRAVVLAVVALRDEVGAADVRAAGDEQLVGREAGDHVAARRGHDDLFLDPRRGPPVGRSAVGLQREDHPFLELDRVLEEWTREIIGDS